MRFTLLTFYFLFLVSFDSNALTGKNRGGDLFNDKFDMNSPYFFMDYDAGNPNIEVEEEDFEGDPYNQSWDDIVATVRTLEAQEENYLAEVDTYLFGVHWKDLPYVDTVPLKGDLLKWSGELADYYEGQCLVNNSGTNQAAVLWFHTYTCFLGLKHTENPDDDFFKAAKASLIKMNPLLYDGVELPDESIDEGTLLDKLLSNIKWMAMTVGDHEPILVDNFDKTDLLTLGFMVASEGIGDYYEQLSVEFGTEIYNLDTE